MSIDTKLEREIPHLHEEDFKKLFPEEYYKKYAAHHNVQQFEVQLLKETKQPQRSTLSKVQSQPYLDKQIKVTKMSPFDPLEDVILKNKQETKRMRHFVKEINHEIKVGPVVNTTKLRTPLSGFAGLSEGVFDRLKLIEDAEYETELRKFRQKQQKDRKEVKFVTRGEKREQGGKGGRGGRGGRGGGKSSISLSKYHKYQGQTQKSLIAESIESKSIKEYPPRSNTLLLQSINAPNFGAAQSIIDNRSLPYSDRIQKILRQTKSEIVHLNPEDRQTELKCIMSMNQSIKKISNLEGQIANERRHFQTTNPSKLKTMSSSSQIASRRERKDLVQLTSSIRKQVSGIEMLSNYTEAMSQKQLQMRIQQME